MDSRHAKIWARLCAGKILQKLESKNAKSKTAPNTKPRHHRQIKGKICVSICITTRQDATTPAARPPSI
ncbi:hypothetical protein [Helicobacter sp. CLO-3]|uniref:hypothetical protein n=1 Tax=Helicobacter sp. CLO-3 TaxID=211 RepID=UPI0015A487FD|nr:hypothetical protein [Helicobacter sp. CLO-3]